MKLHSPNLELRAIKTICAGGKASNQILGALSTEMLNTSAASTAYRRMIALTRKGGELPSWSTLCEDPIISESDRKTLRNFKKPTLKPKETQGALNLLKAYSYKRGLAILADNIMTTLSEDKVDIDALVNSAVDQIHKVRAGSKQAKVHKFGAGSNVKKMLKSIVKGTGIKGVPSFLEAWDDANKVIPQDACVMVAAPTGGGKSIFALNMGMNQAQGGFTVCLGSFEMTPESNMVRMIARQAKIPIHKIVQGEKGLTKKEQKRAVADYLAWEAKCDKSGGALYIVENETLPTVTEFLYSCKAYAPDIIIIDYLALLDGIDGDDDWRALAEAVRQCKRFATANRIPVVFLAQLSDDGQSLRYSKRMLDDCDIAWFLRADVEDKEAGILPVTHRKARNCSPVKFSLHTEYEFSYMRTATDKDKSGAVKKKTDKTGSRSKDGKAKAKRTVLRDLASASVDDL